MLRNWMDDFRRGLRQLVQRPGFAIAAMASLALGIGANTILFGVVNALLLQGVPGASEPQRLVEVGRGSPESRFDTFSTPDLEDVAKSVPALSSLFAYHFAPLNVRIAGGDPRRALGFVVSESYFETLGVTAALGRTFAASDAGKLDATPAVVISDKAWRRYFAADPSTIGRTLVLNGASFTVMGVAPASFSGHVAAAEPEFYVPLTLSPLVNASARTLLTSRNSRWLLAGGRLADGATLDQAQQQLDALGERLRRQFPDTHKKTILSVTTLSRLPASVREMVMLFAGVMFALVGLILVLACVNVAGMLIARGESRGGEMAIRAALGASRRRIVRQLFAEGLVLAGLAGVVGVVLAYWGRGLLSLVSIPAPFPIEFTLPLDGRVVAFAALVSIATAVVFAAWPALRLSQRDPRQALAAGGSTGTLARARSRDVLVVAQIAVSLLLLVAAGLFLRSLGRAASVDPGFRAQGVVYADFDLQPAGYDDAKAGRTAEDLLARVRAMPGVESATLGSVLPLSLNRLAFGAVRNPAQPDAWLDADATTVSSDYFKTLGITVRGRDFDANDKRGAEDVAIVNETFAERVIGKKDAIGETFELGEPGDDIRKIRVVGVAGDGKYASLSEDRTSFIFLPNAQRPRQQQNLLVRTRIAPAVLERALRDELAAVDPNLPALSVHALEDVTAVSVLPQRIAGYVASMLGLVGLLLAATGLYGVMAYYVVQRQREIGVRLALGASPESVLREVARRAAWLAGIGMAIGLVLAAVAAQALSSLLFGVTASDALAFLGAALVLAIAAALATIGPAWRAVSIQPSRALRYE